MTGEPELVALASKDAKAGIVQVVIAIHMLEIEHAGVERDRGLHIPDTNCWNNGHHAPLGNAFETETREPGSVLQSAAASVPKPLKHPPRPLIEPIELT